MKLAYLADLRKSRLAAVSFVAMLNASCAVTQKYLHERMDDLRDVVPFSLSYGPGVYVGARATRMAAIGVGYETARVVSVAAYAGPP